MDSFRGPMEMLMEMNVFPLLAVFLLPGPPKANQFKVEVFLISNHFLCKDLVHHPIETTVYCWVVVSNIFHFHPYLGKIPILTNIFQRG